MTTKQAERARAIETLNAVAGFLSDSARVQQDHPEEAPSYASEFDYNLAQAAYEIRSAAALLAADAEVGGEAVATYEGKRTTPFGTREFWGWLADGIEDLPPGTKFFARPQQAARAPLTEERIHELLGIGNPDEETCRLIRLGWNAAYGITGKDQAS